MRVSIHKDWEWSDIELGVGLSWGFIRFVLGVLLAIVGIGFASYFGRTGAVNLITIVLLSFVLSARIS